MRDNDYSADSEQQHTDDDIVPSDIRCPSGVSPLSARSVCDTTSSDVQVFHSNDGDYDRNSNGLLVRGGGLPDMQRRLRLRRSGSGSAQFNELPLGPFDEIKFTMNAVLDRYFNYGIVDDICCFCFDLVGPGDSVLFTCQCCSVVCSECKKHDIGSSMNTYWNTIQSLDGRSVLGISCPTCRSFSSFTATGTDEAKKEELRLLESLFKRF